ncbi:MAG: hypothetical protein HPY62_11555 [Bacteroidales bacterium]|nr:hypothetical protein [Bacteroidales bacterium]
MKIKDAKVIACSPGRKAEENLKAIRIQSGIPGIEKVYGVAGNTPGTGVDIDEKKALRYPFSLASLPVNKKTDGTLFYW